jgi:hypothetical protein
MQAPPIYSQYVPDTPQQASLCTSDTASSFICSAGTTPNYIHASNTHTTTTIQLNYHVTNTNSTLLRSSRKHQQRWQWWPAILAKSQRKRHEKNKSETTRVSTPKKNKPQGTNNSTTQIITTNKSEPLRHAETEGNVWHEREDPAPTPMFVPGITHMQRLATTTEQVINGSNWALKIINSDTIKITTNKLEYHKTITGTLKKLSSTTNNLGNNVRTDW